DDVLKNFAKQLMNQTRVEDIVCRYGGEEFLTILPNINIEIAKQIAEKWRLSFKESYFLKDGKEIKTTISCGIAEFPVSGSSGEELIAMADKAMYHAKATGRNRVVTWQDVKL
ncbi:MAG TPA: sensor domain-containing diguanylate cyclase, partial [Anaerolineae bacterium]|nr:sensor domain-containing diguanylate cyclase [Anaerolineae bacterium]